MSFEKPELESVTPNLNEIITDFDKELSDSLKPEPESISSLEKPEDFNENVNKNPEISFETIKRPYSLSDIESLQDALRVWSISNKKFSENRIPGVSKNSWYSFLSNGSFEPRASWGVREEMNKEKEADPQDWENLILSFYKDWVNNAKKNKDRVLKNLSNHLTGDLIDSLPNPETLDKLRKYYRKNRLLNDISGISYQEGLGAEEGYRENNFLHFFGHRRSGYEYKKPKTELRLYTNPPKEFLPLVAKRFVEIADEEKVPFYFKIIDHSLQQNLSEDNWRLDRMVVYTNRDNYTQTLKIFRKLEQEHPEWFNDRPIPTLTIEVAPGIGAAEEPSREQTEKFGRTSFNELRARFLDEVWIKTIGTIIFSHPHAKDPNDGRTLREIFNTYIDKDADATLFWQHALNVEKVPPEKRNILENALSKAMAEIIPMSEASDLFPYVQKEILKTSQKYGINPENIATNIS